MEACTSPMKLVHVLWSLEYMDSQGISLFNHEMTHFLRLENSIGQFPAQSPDCQVGERELLQEVR